MTINYQGIKHLIAAAGLGLAALVGTPTVEAFYPQPPAVIGEAKETGGPTQGVREHVPQLTAGWNVITYNGPETPIEELIAGFSDKVRTIWHFDNRTQKWHGLSPSAPSWANDLNSMVKYNVYFINVSKIVPMRDTLDLFYPHLAIVPCSDNPNELKVYVTNNTGGNVKLVFYEVDKLPPPSIPETYYFVDVGGTYIMNVLNEYGNVILTKEGKLFCNGERVETILDPIPKDAKTIVVKWMSPNNNNTLTATWNEPNNNNTATLENIVK